MHRRDKGSSKSRRVYSEIADQHPVGELIRELERLAQPSRWRTNKRIQTVPESRERLKLELLRIHHRQNATKNKPKQRHRRRKTSRLFGNDNNDKSFGSFSVLQGYGVNYLKLSSDFVVNSKYQIPTRTKPTCVICFMNRSTHAVFPCEHLCLCNDCLDSRAYPEQCPLCNMNVSVVLEYTSDVIENYWKWVDEVKSSLTSSFIEKFNLNSYESINARIATKQRTDTDILEQNVVNADAVRERYSCWTRLFQCHRRGAR